MRSASVVLQTSPYTIIFCGSTTQIGPSHRRVAVLDLTTPPPPPPHTHTLSGIRTGNPSNRAAADLPVAPIRASILQTKGMSWRHFVQTQVKRVLCRLHEQYYTYSFVVYTVQWLWLPCTQVFTAVISYVDTFRPTTRLTVIRAYRYTYTGRGLTRYCLSLVSNSMSFSTVT